MNNEIKEILDSLKFVIDNPTLEDELGDKQVKIINYTELNAKESKQLLDYITNLQEENKKLQFAVKDTKENADEIICELKEENKELKAKLEMYENGVYYSSENDKLQDRIDKAIKYIEENAWYCYKDNEEDLDRIGIEHILEILGGKND